MPPRPPSKLLETLKIVERHGCMLSEVTSQSLFLLSEEVENQEGTGRMKRKSNHQGQGHIGKVLMLSPSGEDKVKQEQTICADLMSISTR